MVSQHFGQQESTNYEKLLTALVWATSSAWTDNQQGMVHCQGDRKSADASEQLAQKPSICRGANKHAS
jgi:hypothetical protein